LAGKGFETVYNLQGGLNAWQGSKAAGPPEMGMLYLSGKESPLQVIALAYGMEEATRAFYARAAAETASDELKDLLTKMAAIEEKHKQRLFDLRKSLDPAAVDRQAFEDSTRSEVMEGGLDPEDFYQRLKPVLNSTPDVLNIAMMLEAQGLDLYLRYAREISAEDSQKIFYEIAEEEKGHLNRLAELLEKTTSAA
jgi:rubrerythrin